MSESAFTTDGIRFNTSGLMLRKNEPARQLWLNAFNDVIEFRAFDLQPDIPVRLSDARGLRAFYDAGAVAQQGSVIGLEVRAVQKFRGSTARVATARPTTRFDFCRVNHAAVARRQFRDQGPSHRSDGIGLEQPAARTCTLEGSAHTGANRIEFGLRCGAREFARISG